MFGGNGGGTEGGGGEGGKGDGGGGGEGGSIRSFSTGGGGDGGGGEGGGGDEGGSRGGDGGTGGGDGGEGGEGGRGPLTLHRAMSVAQTCLPATRPRDVVGRQPGNAVPIRIEHRRDRAESVPGQRLLHEVLKPVVLTAELLHTARLSARASAPRQAPCPGIVCRPTRRGRTRNRRPRCGRRPRDRGRCARQPVAGARSAAAVRAFKAICAGAVLATS
eukprot:scaffold65940_cov68-Phaeocystis_antarctica.AAC.9